MPCTRHNSKHEYRSCLTAFYRSLSTGLLRRLVIAVLSCTFCLKAHGQQPLTWEQVKERFQANNPTLRAGQLNVDEAKANEITANLRPNPQLGIVLDQFSV